MAVAPEEEAKKLQHTVKTVTRKTSKEGDKRGGGEKHCKNSGPVHGGTAPGLQLEPISPS